MCEDFDKFYVITVISNPIRYKTRYDIYFKFKAMCEAAGVKLITVEQAFGARDFVLTERDNPYHLQIRSIDELWHKENMINLGLEYLLQLDPEAKYMAWVDADVFPMMTPKDWFKETWHALQHYQVVQMFEYAQDLNPIYNMSGEAKIGFMAAYVKSGYKKPNRDGCWELDYYLKFGHPGYAWAANISALNDLGGLIDQAMLGAGDRHMALALIGEVEQSFPHEINRSYKRVLTTWQRRANRYIRSDVGYLPGTIYHYWHGSKKLRGYASRWKILVDNQYNPTTDLKRDSQGLYQLETFTKRQMMLRDQVRSYFRSRNEDGICLDG